MNNALIIFTRNPELGKCKTRLAKTIGDEAALQVYKYLLQHTAKVAQQINADRFVFYSEAIQTDDIWDDHYFKKALQTGDDLGERMANAFQQLFKLGYQKCLIIGSDLLDLDADIISKAYKTLETHNVVMGPAQDGGYYLLGLKNLYPNLFKNKAWGKDTVRKATLKDLKNHAVHLLKELNDIDTFEDMKHYQQLKHLYTTNA